MRKVKPGEQGGGAPGGGGGGSLGPAADGACWMCLHTRSRREKRVAADCLRSGIPHFLPLRKSVRRYSGRTYVFEVPLFSGYLFCAATPEQRRALLATNNLAEVLEVPDEAEFLEDLKQIARAIEQAAPLEPYPYLKRGARVRITGGPFEGLEGIVSERKKKYRVVMNVRMLHQAVALEIDLDSVRAV